MADLVPSPSMRRRSTDMASLYSVLPPPYVLDDIAAEYDPYSGNQNFGPAFGAISETPSSDLPSRPASSTAKPDSSVVETISRLLESARILGDTTIKVRDAKTDATAIGQEAQALSSTLTKLHKWFLTGAIRPSAAALLSGTANTCLVSANQLSKVIQPYTTVSRTTKITMRSLKSTLNKTEVQALRLRWHQAKTTLVISLEMINSHATRSKDEELKLLLSQIDLQSSPNRGRRAPPPKDHPWVSMSEPEDLFECLPRDTDTEERTASTLTEDPDLMVDIRTTSPTPLDDALSQESLTEQSPDLDHRLCSVSSQPITRSEFRDLDVVDDGMSMGYPYTQRSNTFPAPADDRTCGDPEARTGDAHHTRLTQQIHGSLHQALKEEDTYRFMSLLKAGADVNELGRHNRTPLHVCALLDDRVSAQSLLRTGRADLSQRDTHDRTSLQCALEVGHDRLACMLLQLGANIEDVAHFTVEMTGRRSKPVEERATYACLAWLTERNDFEMEARFVETLVAAAGSSPGSIARFLEGTPFREPYVQKSSVRSGSREWD